MKKILAVDLCNTLYKSNTTQDFFEYSFKDFDDYKALKAKNKNINFKVINKLSNKILKNDMSKKLITNVLKDRDVEEINNLVEKFIDNFLEEKKISKAQEIIRDYKEKGYYIIMISASYDFIAKAVAKRLNIDEVIASSAYVENNKFTGRVKEDILYTKFAKFLDKFKDYDDLVMITDNETDYDFVKNTTKSFIVIHEKNKRFWEDRKSERLIFIEE